MVLAEVSIKLIFLLKRKESSVLLLVVNTFYKYIFMAFLLSVLYVSINLMLQIEKKKK